MSLKGKLSRLGPGAPLSASERERVQEGRRETPHGARRAPVTRKDGTSGVTPSLDELREKMDAIMGSSVPREQRAAAPLRQNEEPTTGLGDLPFVTRQTEQGTLTERLEAQRPSASVGRVSLSGAAQAEMELLSLLALDPQLAQVDPRKLVFFDTETTGLGGAGTLAFLVGLAWFDEDGTLMLEQQLLASPADEVALLERLRALVDGASCLVSYNGKSFDWPLLQSRCVMNRVPELSRRPHLDLLHVARRLHKRRLQRFRLIHLESDVLGWERHEDDIPGAEIAPRYGHFLRSRDGGALSAVVDHNAWDVLSMVALVALYGEPLADLHSLDLVGMADTLLRAKDHDRALGVSGRALAEGGQGSVEALHSRARIFKALGDRARALNDFESLSEEVDDAGVRLELAKLYEHHAKDYERALQLVVRGTDESEAALLRRTERLERKLRRQRRRGPSSEPEG